MRYRNDSVQNTERYLHITIYILPMPSVHIQYCFLFHPLNETYPALLLRKNNKKKTSYFVFEILKQRKIYKYQIKFSHK